MKSDKHKVTIQDVADAANVSITTVSRVLNNNYPVNIDTRKRVEEAVEKLNFNPNLLARSLIIKRTEVVGIVVPSITNMFFTMVVKGIQETCKLKGYNILLTDSEGSEEGERECVHNLLSRQVDGIIVIDPRTGNMKSKCYEKAASRTPMVFINGYNEGLNYNFVINDQIKGTVEALKYLIGLSHISIAFVRGYQSYSYDIKEQVYKEVLSRHNISLKDENIINIGEGNSVETVDNTFNVIYPMLVKGSVPTAFFACNDLMAIGILNACKKASVKVPEEVSIIGFDNIALSQLSEPKITTVDQNMRELGTQAANMILDIFEDEKDEQKRLVLNTRLIVRESCSTPVK